MDIRIAFFDIDGTLIQFGEGVVRPVVSAALRRLRDSGVRLFICTGRSPALLPRMEDTPFDGWITFNGSYIRDDSGVLFEDPLPTDDIIRVVANAGEMGLPVLVANARGYGVNFYHQALEDYMSFSKRHCDVVAPARYEEYLRDTVYQLMVGTLPEQDERLIRGTRGVKIVRWWDRAVDVVPALCGKARGMACVLERLGLSREQCMAFGDGANDIDMLRFAGLGVAMGNAPREVRSAADYIAPACEENGVAVALRRLGLISGPA